MSVPAYSGIPRRGAGHSDPRTYGKSTSSSPSFQDSPSLHRSLRRLSGGTAINSLGGHENGKVFGASPTEVAKSNKRELESQSQPQSPKSSIKQVALHFQKRLLDLQQIISQSQGISNEFQETLKSQVRIIGFELAQSLQQLDADTSQSISEKDRLQTEVNDLREKFNEISMSTKLSQNDSNSSRHQVDQKAHPFERISPGGQPYNRGNEIIAKAPSELSPSVSDPFCSPNLPRDRGQLQLYNLPGSLKQLTHSPTETRHEEASEIHGTSLSTVLSGAQSLVTNETYNEEASETPKSSGYSYRGQMGYPNLPTGSAVIENSPQSIVAVKQPGDSPVYSTALIVHQDVDTQFDKLQTLFAKLFRVSEGWVRIYAHIPYLQGDFSLSKSTDLLWAYLTKALYPDEVEESRTHAIALLGDPVARPWYIMRIIITYCFDNMLNIETFYGFSDETDDELDKVEFKAHESTHTRTQSQDVINRQSKLIQKIVVSANYSTFRARQLSHHSKRLRDLLGTLLNAGTNRGQAGKDLGAIVVVAWDLAVEMFSSQLSFQIYFPPTTLFMANNMVARNSSITDPYQLQLKQTELKLVITPVITVRDCRSATVRTKNLHYSHVLIKG
ncbi:hypothetical protein F5884DRAFT_299510 [Xylogone sp. PMI_703]|nr:hypothetical protein F5884DRAFT_299510 [Xylogone sp. PMI_703]